MYLKQLKQKIKPFNYQIEFDYEGSDLNDLSIANLRIMQNKKVHAIIDMHEVGIMQTFKSIHPDVLKLIVKFSQTKPNNRINDQPIEIGMNPLDYDEFRTIDLSFTNVTAKNQPLQMSKAQLFSFNHVLKHLKATDLQED